MSSSNSHSNSHARKSIIPFWRDERVLTAAAQVISAIIFIGALIWVGVNLLDAAKQRGLSLGFDFINDPAGFPISEAVIPYDDSYTFGTAFMVGLLNTLKVSIIGIVLATVLGTIVGLARLSTNWLVNRIALAYIELHRNIPLLVLLFIWYFAIFNKLPPSQESLELPGLLYINQRGLYLSWPRLTETGSLFAVSLLIGLILAIIAWITLRRLRERSGHSTYFAGVSFVIILVSVVLGLALSAWQPLWIDTPVFEGFNFTGGLRLTPEFTALLVGLVMYTAAFIAEVVRGGIQAVDLGQTEAAKAVGLKQLQTLGLVIIPQAMRVIIPPLISQFLNLTKNTSLALAIGYADLFNVGRIMINQAGRAVPIFGMIMVTYLLISLITSLILNLYNRKIQISEKST
ncbi:MAG: ABC transporter permease subunit [Anaerolineales bacterium]|nr:ABC transporter permease subunit [Anaerolineales bacterium]